LVEAAFSSISLQLFSLLSDDGGFVAQRPTGNHSVESNKDDFVDDDNNVVQFRSTLSVMFLNTKHNHMECFIEPYPCFGHASYKIVQHDPHDNFPDDNEEFSFSINLHCPRFFYINASPAFFETASIFAKTISESHPESYRRCVHDRDVAFVRNIWDAQFQAEPAEKLMAKDALNVLRLAAITHWKDENEGLSPEEKENMVLDIFGKVERYEGSHSSHIHFSAIEIALRVYSLRSNFAGCKEIQVKNNIGRELQVSSNSVMKSYPSFQSSSRANLGYSHVIKAGNSAAIPLQEETNFRIHSLRGKLSLSTPGYKRIDNVIVSPYQSAMFSLKRLKRKHGKRRIYRRARNASGFSPYLTIVPKSAQLDVISLHIRTCVTFRTEIPVNIRIVRLASLDHLRKRGSKHLLDLTKKNFIAVLRQLVEGAPIVYEKKGISESIGKKNYSSPIPLDVLDSSHFHCLLIQDATNSENNSWRDPILLTKDFLLNPMHVGEITRCHAMSGILVQKERLNVKNSDAKDKYFADNASNRSILRRTAWDTTILCVPFFLLLNSLPFPLMVRTWAYSEGDEDDLWDDVPVLDSCESNEWDLSSDDDTSFVTPKLRGMLSGQFHYSTDIGHHDYFTLDCVGRGDTLRLSGINLRQPLFIQVSQYVETADERDAELMWTSPLQLNLFKLRTGMNSKKGVLSLPKRVLDIGDDCDALVDVSVEERIRMPICTIYSPFWIMNKTGMKLQYRVSNQSKRYFDSGVGGLPIMIHCGKSEETNKAYKNASREIYVIPLEPPTKSVLQSWWDFSCNGELAMTKNALQRRGLTIVDWSEKIELSAAGTSGEVHCKDYVLNSSIKSLVGAFHSTNLITLSPRFVLKNMLHISITFVPLLGSLHEAIARSRQLRKHIGHVDSICSFNLLPNQSTVIYNFHDTNYGQSVEKTYRWIAFCVNASRFGGSFKSKWHLIPLEVMTSTYFGEHDGINDTMCGILEGKVHASDGGSTVVSIAHAPVPPFRIENRSNIHCIQFVQDDSDGVVFELPPMHSCGYCWDSPLGKKRLRAVVIPKKKSKHYRLRLALKMERDRHIKTAKDVEDNGTAKTADSVSSDDDSIGNTDVEPIVFAIKRGTRANIDSAVELKRTTALNHRNLYTVNSRSYSMNKVGRKKDLPCPEMKTLFDYPNSLDGTAMESNLFAHIRILAGTKILSFNDSPFLAEQVELGTTRKGGNFKSALCHIEFAGVGISIMDDFPREVMGVVIRDIQIHKPRGSIDSTAMVRHFQVDAMLPDARYPIIIQPLPLGVDRRNLPESTPGSIDRKDCYWLKNDEKPVPIFESSCSYVPQSNMVWVPRIDVSISPMKLQLDVDYLLRVVGMIIHSVSKHIGTNNTATSHASNKLKYTTRNQMSALLTYVEKLNISPVWFEIEMNIKSDDRNREEEVEESDLTLNAIARSTTSPVAAGVISWVINVGANFAHVSPSFKYKGVKQTDRYCDILDLFTELAISYIIQTIKQSYKVIFSMSLLGDPKLLAHQYKTGVTDLVLKSRDEFLSGGKDGVGKGATSFLQNVIGGTFFAVGKVAGGVADTIDSVTSNEMTSNHLKPKSLANADKPEHVVDGVIQGTTFLGQTVAHGFAGLIGNPYRGAKTGGVTGLAKGVASGTTGLFVAPFVGALGFIAKSTDGIGSTTKYLDLGVIEARCRPARTIPWGKPMAQNGLPFLKAIGVRIHTVRYQRIRKRVNRKQLNDKTERDDEDWQASKEYKRIRAAEDRRKCPPRKIVSIIHNKEKQHFLSSSVRPKLLEGHPGNLVISHYALTFEDTIILRSADFQLQDEVAINVWNTKMLKSATTKTKPLAVCKLTVGDIYASIFNYYKQQLSEKESRLSTIFAKNSEDLFSQNTEDANQNKRNKSIIIPPPQEFAMFRPGKDSKSPRKTNLEAIGEELASIKKDMDDFLNDFDSESSETDSDSSFLGGEKEKEESIGSVIKANEKLASSISLSFFPIPW